MTAGTNTANKNEYQATLLSNRIAKRLRHLRKWAKRSGVSCFRLYDRDIPEIPLAVDLYELVPSEGRGTEQYLRVYLYERPYEKSDGEERAWLSLMSASLAETAGISICNIITKTRRRQRGSEAQYEKESVVQSIEGIVREQGLLFKVNLSDYLDTGLFLDHRPLRQIVREQCAGKSVLNLFCYTGAFSVYAAAGGAKSVDSVDLSNTYLGWAKENFLLNGFSGDRYSFIRADVTEFLAKTSSSWDIIVLDPPTFSNSKKTHGTLDVNRDWPRLAGRCLDLLNPGGILYFSTNSRHLSLDAERLPKVTRRNTVVQVTDITSQTIPEDFRNDRIHRCWKIATGRI